MFLVDTNILLYAVNPDFNEHPAAFAAIEKARDGSELWFLTWGVIYEFLRVSTHRAVFSKPLSLAAAWDWINRLRESQSCQVLAETERHTEIMGELLSRHARMSGNVVHDLHTAALMLEHGVQEIRTADADFHQFKFLRVVNPVT